MQNIKKHLHPIALFFRFFKVGVIGFGGGSALIPVIERELVGQGKPMGESDYLKHTVIANITPGALPVKLGATCGYQLGGIWGSLAGAYGAMLPGVSITVLIMSLFSLMGTQAVTLFNYASVGISVFIIMLLINYTLKTCSQGQEDLNWSLCLIAFLLTCGKEIRQLLSQILSVPYEAFPPALFDLSTVSLMIATFLLVIFQCAHPSKKEMGAAALLTLAFCLGKGKLLSQLGYGRFGDVFLAILVFFVAAKVIPSFKQPTENTLFAAPFSKDICLSIAMFLLIPLLLFCVLIFLWDLNCFSFLGSIALSTVTSFGGGEAYVSVADGFFVQGGYISADTYYTKLVPVANALPGPILVKITAGIGFLFGSESFGSGVSWFLAAAAAALSVGVCCSLALFVLQVYESVEHSVFVTSLKLYILPVICGMLLSTSCSMLYEASKITTQQRIPALPALLVMLFWVTLLRYLHKRFRVHDLLLLLGSAGISLVFLLFF